MTKLVSLGRAGRRESLRSVVLGCLIEPLSGRPASLARNAQRTRSTKPQHVRPSLAQRQGDVHGRWLGGGAQLDDGGAEDVHRDHEIRHVVRLVLVVGVVDPDADYAVALELMGLPPEAEHGLGARVVEAAGEVGELLVLPRTAEHRQPLTLLPAGHRVTDGCTGDEAGRPPAMAEELRELLARQVREHRPLTEVEALAG